MTFHLPVLKFNPDALVGLISNEALYFHYEKHHGGYIEKTNQLLETEFRHLQDESLEEICRLAENPLADQARQAWNHTFYWDCIGSGTTSVIRNKSLRDSIGNSFGNFQAFEEAFKKEALEIFGSGWLWLVRRDQDHQLALVKTQGSEQPFWNNARPLLVCDVWEHAYYIDFRNERKAYIDLFWSHIDWSFVELNLGEMYSATARMIATPIRERRAWKNQLSAEKRLKSI